MCVVPGNEAAHSGPTNSGGRGVRIGVRRILVDEQNACEPTRNEFPWICISGALELAGTAAPARSLRDANSGSCVGCSQAR